MIITVEFKGQDHQVFVPDDMYTFLQNDAEQLNKYLLHILKNNTSKPGTGSLFDTTLGIDDEYIEPTADDYEEDNNENPEALINAGKLNILEHTANDDVPNNDSAKAVLELDKSTTEMYEDEALNSPNAERWPKNHVLVLIDAFEKNKHMFSSTTIRKEKVWQAISKHLKNTAINKTATQCDNKWKNLRKLYLKKQRNKKATSSGQSAFHFEFEEEFDKIYKDEPSISPVALAGNLIVEENATIYDDNITEDMPKAKKKKTDSINTMHLLIEKKEENRVKRHIEMMELQNKSLQLQQDALEAYKNTMDQFLTIYKNNSTK